MGAAGRATCVRGTACVRDVCTALGRPPHTVVADNNRCPSPSLSSAASTAVLPFERRGTATMAVAAREPRTTPTRHRRWCPGRPIDRSGVQYTDRDSRCPRSARPPAEPSRRARAPLKGTRPFAGTRRRRRLIPPPDFYRRLIPEKSAHIYKRVCTSVVCVCVPVYYIYTKYIIISWDLSR